VNNWNYCDCFLKSKENTTTDLSINQCTVIQTYFCCYLRKYLYRWTKTKILNPPLAPQSDFKYPSDFGKSVGFRFGIRHIPNIFQWVIGDTCGTVSSIHQRWTQSKTTLYVAIPVAQEWRSRYNVAERLNRFSSFALSYNQLSERCRYDCSLGISVIQKWI